MKLSLPGSLAFRALPASPDARFAFLMLRGFSDDMDINSKMALVQFSCVATGPFIAFKETVERIFKAINEPFHDKGGFMAEDLPDVLRRLDEAAAADKAKAAKLEEEREKRLREGSYENEIRMLEAEREDEEKKKNREDSIRLYQRMVPLQDMIRRAIKHKKPIMWTTLGRY